MMANEVAAKEVGYAIADFAATYPLVAIMALWLVVILMRDPRFWHVVGKMLVLILLAYVPFWLALEGERLAASLVAVGVGLAGGAIYISSFWQDLVWLLRWLSVLAVILLFMIGIATANNTAGAIAVTLAMGLWWAWPWLESPLRKWWRGWRRG
ncbi:MAG: hypothetical protein OXM87_05155 [Truepera sp.]|nr:hypothetical protein [Truepera sp.]